MGGCDLGVPPKPGDSAVMKTSRVGVKGHGRILRLGERLGEGEHDQKHRCDHNATPMLRVFGPCAL